MSDPRKNLGTYLAFHKGDFVFVTRHLTQSIVTKLPAATAGMKNVAISISSAFTSVGTNLTTYSQLGTEDFGSSEKIVG
ncbi:MAG: hypothetical protein JWO80_391 [Bryobacterales bacterium]|nr:hypothetical protein [Bryobacterales bacterium]